MDALASQASLISAVMGLEATQLIVNAIQAVNQSGAAQGGGSAGASVLGPAATYEPRGTIQPEPRYLLRPVLHPTPRIEPRIIDRPATICPEPICSCLPPAMPEESRITPSPIQPPWAVLPWQCPPAPALKIKLVALRPDNCNNVLYKGSVIDCFI